MICTTCGADALELDARDITQTYKGRTNIIKNVAALFCASCGAADLRVQGGEADRVSHEMVAFMKKVDQDQSD
jgi:YgiT-type zinc finger domain-containing protein